MWTWDGFITELTREKYVQVGLVIHPDQPWLSCSPDGIVCCDDGYRLVEIKCPYKLRDSELIDHRSETSFVPYVKYVDGRLILKKSHRYYTQVMVMMYILDVVETFLFVYSPKQDIIVTVPRDEEFLAEYIPKLEYFYFHYMLEAILEQH